MDSLEVPHTISYTLEAYERHPYKYTFYGLKKLCENYGVKAEGLLIEDKDEIEKLGTPFIAELAHDYVLVKAVSSEHVKFEIYGEASAMSLDDFKNSWDGHVLLCYSDAKSIEPDYKTHKRSETLSRLEVPAIAMCLLFLLGLAAYGHPVPSWPEAMVIILSLFGLALSLMLLSQQLRVQSRFVESVCHAFRKSSCNNVLETKAAKVFGRYSWSEIGVSYFVVNTVCLLASADLTPILAYIAAPAVLYSFWSIWYQRHISQWCPLCVMVQAVIILQFVAYLTAGFYYQPFVPEISSILFVLAAYIAVALLLNKFLSVLGRSRQLDQARWEYNHLKLDDKIFKSLLLAEKEVPTEGSSILFGNEKAKYRVTIFSNPYCNPCAAMHKRLQKLVDAGDFLIQYYFTSFKSEWNNINKLMIAAHQQLGPDKTWEAFNQWYDKGKFKQEAFFKDFLLDPGDAAVNAEFEAHENWRKETGLDATPTVIVNGHLLPGDYTVDDLTYFV